jgi:cytochrome c-type biogenesis protein CcmH
MTIFLLASAALLLTTLAVVTWPLLRARGAGRSLRREVDVAGRQLRQLEALHAGGALTNEQFAQSRTALERRLVDALASAGERGTGGAAPVPRSPRLALALAAFMMVVTVGGYWFVGSPRHLGVGPGQAATDTAAQGAPEDASTPAPHDLSRAQVEQMVEQLATRLQTHPDDAQGWTMLARSRVALGQHDKALEAFVQAERLMPDNPDLLADHADALAMAHGRRLDGEPQALLQRALAIDPHHPKALALAGTAAFDRKDYKKAVQLWETLAQVEPPDGPFAAQVRDGIAEARQLAGLPPAAASTPAPAAGPQGATLSGTVTLAPELAGRASPGDVLFVFARAVDGPRMPVAIVRKSVKDLPLAFTLDDSMAMSPENSLSSAKRVILGARISRSGNAVPRDGDLQGATPAVEVGASGVRLEIDQVVGN